MATARAAAADADTRERILAAALEVFSQHGFDGARTRDIAARAGVPLGLLSYHFGTKAALWRAAVDRAFDRVRAELGPILTDPEPADPRERLRRLIRAYVAFVARHPEFVRLMHDEGKRGGPRMRWMVDRHVKPVFAAVAPLVERAQAAGLAPPGVAPAHLFYALLGAAGLVFHQAEECRRVAGLDPRDPAAARAHARVVEHLFLGPEKETSP